MTSPRDSVHSKKGGRTSNLGSFKVFYILNCYNLMITYELSRTGKGGLGKIFGLPSHLYLSYRK